MPTKPKTVKFDVKDTRNTGFERETLDFEKNLFENTKLKNATATAPTYDPKTFYEQIVLYESGATIRLYVWVAGTWRYASLT